MCACSTVLWFVMMVLCLQAGANVVPREGDEMTRLPFLRTWFRTRSAMVLHLSNGTLQVTSRPVVFLVY